MNTGIPHPDRKEFTLVLDRYGDDTGGIVGYRHTCGHLMAEPLLDLETGSRYCPACCAKEK